MGLHLLPLVAAGTVGALVANKTQTQNGLLHDTAVSVTAGALNIKNSITKDFEDIINEAEAKNNNKKTKK